MRAPGLAATPLCLCRSGTLALGDLGVCRVDSLCERLSEAEARLLLAKLLGLGGEFVVSLRRSVSAGSADLAESASGLCSGPAGRSLLQHCLGGSLVGLEQLAHVLDLRLGKTGLGHAFAHGLDLVLLFERG